MKRFVTTIAIVALLMVPPVVSAANAVADHVWDSGSGTSAWSTAGNWTLQGKPDNCNDTATISLTTNNPVQLSEDIVVGTFTMSGATSFDANGWTLGVNGTATFDSTSNTSCIVLDNSSTGTGDVGSIDAKKIFIDGGDNGTCVVVTDTGDEGMTLQTVCSITCP
jgi:hypothetical protein